MTTTRRYLVIAVVGIVAIAAALAVLSPPEVRQKQGGRRGAGSGEGPVPVLVAAAALADVPIYLEGVGTVRALNTVTVRPQVDGKLIKVSFKEGQDVEAGYVLAEIDPTTYQAQLDQATAKKAQDQALLANAKLDLERYEKLAASTAGTRQQADTQKSTVAQLDAQVRLDQAAIDNAQAYLSYTKIIAPLAGRTGIRQVDQGNIVHASDATGIVVITQIRPISVFFSLPQQNLPRINAAFAKDPLAVEAIGGNDRTVVGRGTLQVVDNQVDQATGTVKLKAEFPNPDLQLWPGQFVNVRLLIETLPQVVVVPTAAVQRGPSGTFVYVVQDDTAAMRPVTVSNQDENRSVIASGLKPDERVVTTGFARLTDGSAVTVEAAGAGEQPPAPRPPRGKRRESASDGRTREGAPKAAP
ncbi:MAG TPA: efflux RND transporter periplasmic adaptor subunit [Xanthobacteraceae bacterium]|nr:efflux RND transporter periplasmic adaptor subunit [Xanthobacteraceae bacterium]